MIHPSLLRTFGFSAISTYDSYLPSIFGTNALIWGFFQNFCKANVWSHWGRRTFMVEFEAATSKSLQLALTYRVSHIEMTLMNWLWRIEICKLNLVWRWFWNAEIRNAWVAPPFFKKKITSSGLNTVWTLLHNQMNQTNCCKKWKFLGFLRKIQISIDYSLCLIIIWSHFV